MATYSGLIGYTGFVGSNLLGQYCFEHKYNSKNIELIDNKTFDMLVCAGAPGEKWFANAFPEEDFNSISELIKHLRLIKVGLFILISTVDVYGNLVDVDECTTINEENLSNYGKNRYRLENFVVSNFPEHVIIRLPALFGQGIKKNLIYDLIWGVPSVIPMKSYYEILNNTNINAETSKLLIESYSKNGFGYMRLNRDINNESIEMMRKYISSSKINPLGKINPNSTYQYYYLQNLWRDISVASNYRLKLVNFATEPISNKELIKSCFKNKVHYNLNQPAAHYDVKTLYSKRFRSSNLEHYLYTKTELLNQLTSFISNSYIPDI